MRFGCCTGIEGIAGVEAAGYDYIELPVGTVRPGSPESDWQPIRREILAHEVKPEAWNVLLPRDLHITGPDVDSERVRKYLEVAFDRIGQVGGRVVVFGSGGARTVPDGFPREDARHQLSELIRLAGELAHRNALRLAIEPLNRRESNVINTVAEALTYAEALNHPSVGVLVDFYHLDEEGEPFSDIVEARHYLVHTHTADTGRRHPGSGSYDYAGFMAALRSAGYDARMSVECAWGRDVDKERKEALEFLRRL